jgi:hypothetical protein
MSLASSRSAAQQLLFPSAPGVYLDHLKAVRIPLVIIVLGVVLTFWLDQIHELFVLLMTDRTGWWRPSIYLTTALLGFAVWHSARTVYRFDVPGMPLLSDPRAAVFRIWFPRLLGAVVPLLMAFGVSTALLGTDLGDARQDADWSVPIVFLIEAAALVAIFVTRRHLIDRRRRGRRESLEDPRVQTWSALEPSVRRVYYTIMLLNLAALFLARYTPDVLAKAGPLSIIVLCASFLTITGTYLTIQAARCHFPLLSLLFGLTVLWQLIGANDNHRVRLTPSMHSFQGVPSGLPGPSPAIAKSFAAYVVEWQAAPGPSGPIYIVSAEGGGIRATAWTALVLGELEQQSHGEFSKHMLFGSGVSGGSLGLALFAAIVKGERQHLIELSEPQISDGALEHTDVVGITATFNTIDYLAPTVESMFLTDALQRFFPWRSLVDRGETLERAWARGWTQACESRPSRPAAWPRSTAGSAPPPDHDFCGLFNQPWQDLWTAPQRMPALFFNSTDVATGRRFIQHPFAAIQTPAEDAKFFSASLLATGWPPASAPLNAVVHNSARFTYVSPAGTLLPSPLFPASTRHQLVDGGYFENSGTTTLAELATIIAPLYKSCTGPQGLASEECPIRVIHISNDPGVEPLRSDDACLREQSKPPTLYGEIRAPVLALANTRDARAALSRSGVRNLFVKGHVVVSEETVTASDRFYHFRLCKGQHHLPLGWTLSEQAMQEMHRQLTQQSGANNFGQLREIVRDVLTPAATVPNSR